MQRRALRRPFFIPQFLRRWAGVRQAELVPPIPQTNRQAKSPRWAGARQAELVPPYANQTCGNPAMSRRVVYFNGRFVPESEARVSIFDSALMFGDMAFEMTRTYHRRPFKLREHLQRLYASLRLMEIDCGLTLEEMERATLDTLERNLSSEPAD